MVASEALQRSKVFANPSPVKKNPSKKTKFASQAYRENLSRWLTRMQDVDSFNKSDRELGIYMADFIRYYEQVTGEKTGAREGDKNGYANRWRTAPQKSNFQKLDPDSWELKFIQFCITGNIYSDLDVTEYLESGDESLLPKNAWKHKKIPLYHESRSSIDFLINRIEILEQRVKSLEQESATLKELLKMQAAQKNISISFSALLEKWVKEEAIKSQMPLDIVITDLSNRLGSGSNVFELKDVIYGTYPIVFNRFKHYVLWIGALGILTDENGKPYTGKELLELPPGVSFTS
ncbi:hypothetical protein [Pseudanabaena sp. 'Roaring Creek']|uniref:hypothetical protein n=1 Tax=Pseudanabaena sp. 'Roaring Creek' TaxID=1681830 RepID=UPI0006D81FB0|nr:hypothetical protein [Pseudanabaena sp. 'Roaring Creek']